MGLKNPTGRIRSWVASVAKKGAELIDPSHPQGDGIVHNGLEFDISISIAAGVVDYKPI